MEKFNPDEKMMVLMKLPAEEVFVVCETSREMNQICKKEQYSDMWQSKIKTEYNVDSKEIKGRDGYEKYKYLDQLYNQTFYTVLIINTEQPEYSSSELFDSRDKAEKFIYSKIIEHFENDTDVTHSKMSFYLNFLNYVSIHHTVYRIEETKLKMARNEDMFEEFYENDWKEEIAEYMKDLEIINSAFDTNDVEEFISDFNGRYGFAKVEKGRTTKAKSMIDEFVDDYSLTEEDNDKIKEMLKRILL